MGADGRIFGSGINFNTTSLSDIGSEIIIAITKITSHHCHHNGGEFYSPPANVVLVASLLGVLYYLAFSGESTSGINIY